MPNCPTPTKKGTPCRGRVPEGDTYCAQHDPDRTIAERKPEVRGDWKARFIDAFREHRKVTVAMSVSGVSRSALYEARHTDTDFGAAWLEVEEEIVEELEAEAYRRAVTGVQKPLVSAGKYVTDVTEYSDSLLTLLLRARRPERYRERHTVEHSGEVTHTQTTAIVLDPELSKQALDLLSRAAVQPIEATYELLPGAATPREE